MFRTINYTVAGKVLLSLPVASTSSIQAPSPSYSSIQRSRRWHSSQPGHYATANVTQQPRGSCHIGVQVNTGAQTPYQQPQQSQQHQQQQQDHLPWLPQGEWRERTQLLIGDEGLQRLASARVLVVGLGGVGSYAAEFLARAGVGSLVIVDNDTVDLSNVNRQLPALHSTVGQSKAELMATRLRDINPSMHLEIKQVFLTPDAVVPLLIEGALVGPVPQTSSSSSSSSSTERSKHIRSGGENNSSGRQPEASSRAPFDWVLDAIDSLTPKQLLLAAAHTVGLRVMSSMGAGGRRDPSRVKVGPLSATKNDRFAANMRKALRRCGVNIDEIQCVWSDEPLVRSSLSLTSERNRYKRSFYGTISFLPAQFGLMAAAAIINNIIDSCPEQQSHNRQRKRMRSRHGSGGDAAVTSEPLAPSSIAVALPAAPSAVFPSSSSRGAQSSGESTPLPVCSGSLSRGTKDGMTPNKWKKAQLAMILEQYSQQQQQQQQRQPDGCLGQ